MAALDDFLSFLQGASNSAASAVSAPVDGINWALGKVGVPVSKKPVGGSEWLKELGFTAEPKNKTAGLLGEAVGGVLPIVAQAKAPQIAAGLNAIDDKAMDLARQGIERHMVKNGMIQPATVWHGSPHKFDRFDSSKIGTGEGAQAYGHGLYLAESPDVAKSYAQMDSPFAAAGPKGPAATIAALAKIDGGKNPAQYLKDNYAAQVKQWGQADVDAAIKSLETGALYKVDLPDDAIAKMLDWDKPLSQQAPEVQAGLKRYMGPEWEKAWSNMQGVNAYDVIAGGRHGNPTGNVQAAQKLREAGIPGIRYLDGGSRGVGQGTSNFVVFPGNEGLLSILERNGQPLR